MAAGRAASWLSLSVPSWHGRGGAMSALRSQADMAAYLGDVDYTPKSRHRVDALACLLGALADTASLTRSLHRRARQPVWNVEIKRHGGRRRCRPALGYCPLLKLAPSLFCWSAPRRFKIPPPLLISSLYHLARRFDGDANGGHGYNFGRLSCVWKDFWTTGRLH